MIFICDSAEINNRLTICRSCAVKNAETLYKAITISNYREFHFCAPLSGGAQPNSSSAILAPRT
jgi:hypothetical protein